MGRNLSDVPLDERNSGARISWSAETSLGMLQAFLQGNFSLFHSFAVRKDGN